MMPKKTKSIKPSTHIHEYKRVDIVPSWKSKLPKTHKYYKPAHIILACVEPLCSYRLELVLAIGKLAKCSRCKEPFILDKIAVGHSKPHCSDCIVRKDKKQIDKISELLKDI